jgi:nicotinate-nucleotide pyrophosphorylase (carboxylating)
MPDRAVEALIEAALKEDIPAGDITSESIVSPRSNSRAVFVAKEPGILAGIDIAARVFRKIDPKVQFEKGFEDGQAFKDCDVLAEVQGKSVSLLKGERTALNFLQRLSGIATTTRRFVQAIKGTRARILDTRKTTPGFRALEKYSVRMGGGTNHRFSLSDMVLIKDNHLELAGSIAQAVSRARARIKPGIKVEVEVVNFAQAREALEAGADMIMLDNMSGPAMRKVIDWVAGRAAIEISGGVTLKSVRRIALLGPDFISVGGLTHSSRAIDISLEFLK